MSVAESIRVVLVDDHEVVRAGYRRLLETTEDISVVAEAVGGEVAYSVYQVKLPDVLVMDISMPDIGGLEASRKILSKFSKAKILIFSVHENEVFLHRALELGVMGYISKRSASQVLIDAVRQVASGELYIGQEMLPYLVKRTTTPDTDLVSSMSSREFEVFQFMANGKTVNDIAAVLNISPKTAGHHCTSVKRKLGIPDVAGLTRLAIRLGIIFP